MRKYQIADLFDLAKHILFLDVVNLFTYLQSRKKFSRYIYSRKYNLYITVYISNLIYYPQNSWNRLDFLFSKTYLWQRNVI